MSSAKRQEATSGARGGPLRVSFIRFAKWCKVKLEPGQIVYGKVALDGVQPKDLVGEEREIARQLFGDIETVSDRKRKTIAAVCGARGGKSYVMGALTMLWLALTVDVSKVARGQVAGALILAPDLELAAEQLNYVKGLVDAAGLAGTVVKENETRVRFRRGDGKLVEVVVRAIGKGGTGGRGRTLVGCCIDEANFLNTEGFVVNDADAYKAAKIRIIRGGVMVICSTPWVRAGLLYELHRDNHGKDTDKCLSVHAPTIALRVDPDIIELVEEAYEHDPENAAREFGAVFPESSASRFFSEGQLERASANDHVMPRAPRPGATLTAAGDLAFVRNSATLVIAAHYPKVVTKREDGSEVVVSQPYVELVDVLELRPKAGEPLKPSEVCKAFAERMKPWGIKQLMCDGHNREAAREYLTSAGISIEDAPEGQGGKEQTYVDTRAKLKEGRIAIPKEPKRLLLQLGEVQSTQGLRGRLTIKSPLRPDGSHGDLASAFVLAVWKKWGVKVVEEVRHVMPQAERDRLAELQRRLRGLQTGSMADLVSQRGASRSGQAVALSSWLRARHDGGKSRTRTFACSMPSSASARAALRPRETRCSCARCVRTRGSASTRSPQARTSTPRSKRSPSPLTPCARWSTRSTRRSSSRPRGRWR